MNGPRTIEDLSKWFEIRYIFWCELLTYSRRFPRIHSWAVSGIADLLRPLPVRLRAELLGDE
jgi:hypothetical protein